MNHGKLNRDFKCYGRAHFTYSSDNCFTCWPNILYFFTLMTIEKKLQKRTKLKNRLGFVSRLKDLSLSNISTIRGNEGVLVQCMSTVTIRLKQHETDVKSQ